MIKAMPWLASTLLNLLIILAFYSLFDRSVHNAEGRLGTLESMPTAQRELMNYARQLTVERLTEEERTELTKILIELEQRGN